MSWSLYMNPLSENTMIKLLFVVFAVGIRCVSFNVRAPIISLVPGIMYTLRECITYTCELAPSSNLGAV